MPSSNIEVSLVTLDDNLQLLVDEINDAEWDDDNEMQAYTLDSVTAYLSRADTVLIACHEKHQNQRTLLGFASARVQVKPYQHQKWLYIDEVDVCANQRRRGAGTAIMTELLSLAEKEGCEEAWLGAEADNDAANALYRSLRAEDVAPFTGYTFETDED